MYSSIYLEKDRLKYRAFYGVYSPRNFCPDRFAFIVDKLCAPADSYYVTLERGTKTGNHLHANFIYYSTSRDSFNERKKCASLGLRGPEWGTQMVKTGPHDFLRLLKYMNKEVS
jgi:hypothetical protein